MGLRGTNGTMRQVIRSRNSAYRFVDKVCNGLGEQFDPQLIEIKKFKPPRSLEQNALLHCLFREVANHVGRPEDEIKEIFKYQYGTMKKLELYGDVTYVPKGTSEYNKQELSDMVEQVYRKGAEWGVEFSDVDSQ